MSSITTQLVAVDRTLWSGEAKLVTAQTTEGEIGVLPGHQPLLGQLVDNGIVTITPDDGSEKLVAAVQSGFLSVSTDKITVLAERAEWASEINESEAQEKLSSSDPKEKARAEAALKALRRDRAS
ncbi:F0F1 ATP synthase subunit epsilon [Corynebacterium uterequi]|uniref:ATP synthase epsilon chain n=1 Tax=Corynebacterium uterequi TaxID=1072256 RepID=A0A0G3HBX8_9CORY|nr:F0F1 ATP synthase subunit epsilon [Corynebacterium uterequi]AKK10901.1 ATP synthase, F1 epsilon subunit [Corynebacterium uterequi]